VTLATVPVTIISARATLLWRSASGFPFTESETCDIIAADALAS
jgi:hypothetical protein